MQLSLPLFSLAAAGIANAYPAMQMRANQIAAEAKRDLFEFPDNFGGEFVMSESGYFGL